MSAIAQVETAILTQCVSTLPAGVLKDTGSLPGGWTLDMLKRALQFSPGVYVAFTGGNAIRDRNARIDAKFELYAVTKEPLEINRRTGNQRAIGAYEMIETVAAALHNHKIEGIGSMRFEKINNLFRDVMFNLGGTVYGCSVSVDIGFDPVAVAAEDFLTFHADYDIPDFTQNRYPTWLGGDRTTPEAPDAQDTTTLEGP